MKTTTIYINEDVVYTAHQTEAKKLRGGFSAYIEGLVIADFKKKGIELLTFVKKERKPKSEKEA